jgi:hypothetical protein
MTIMTRHGSATLREEASDATTPHINQTLNPNETTRTATIINALKRRAQTVLNDKSIDAQTRTIIRYALENNDLWLAELVRRAESHESIETIDFSSNTLTPNTESPR